MPSWLPQLFGALDAEARLILVGDVDQLPSVGPGKVLHDLIESGVCPVVRLQQVMRQAEDSAIALNAHSLIQGEPLQLDNSKYVDFKFFEIEAKREPREERESTANMLLSAHECVRSELGYDLTQIQVLTPQKNTEIGTNALNRSLRQVLNPPRGDAQEVHFQRSRNSQNAEVFRIGDRVIQTRNNYDLHVMNGEMGTVEAIKEPPPERPALGRFAIVRMDDGREICYPSKLLRELALAYAITVHKSQGSEWPVVIVPVSTSHARLLSRRLLYTAITRGKEVVVMVGTAKALRHAQRNLRDAQRQTQLLALLHKAAERGADGD